MGGRWRPWRALRERDDITFMLADFPPGPVRALQVSGDERQLILIDRQLPPVDRLAALAHELVHVERGGIPRDAPAWLVTKEERHVEDETALRLLPPSVLADWLSRAPDPVTAADIAEEFAVPETIAVRAIDMLRRAG